MKILGFIGVLAIMAVIINFAKLSPALGVLATVLGLAVAATLAAYGLKRPMDALVTLFVPAEKLNRGELEGARRVLGGSALLTITSGAAVAMAGFISDAQVGFMALFYGLTLGGLMLQALALQAAVRAGDMSSARRPDFDRGHDRDRQQMQRREQRPPQPQPSNQPKPGGGPNQPPRGGAQQPNQPRPQPRPEGGGEQREGREGREGRGRNRRNRFRDRHERERSGGQPSIPGTGETRPAPVPSVFVAESLDENRPAPAAVPSRTEPAAEKPAAPAGGVSSLLTSTTGTEL